MLLTACEKKEDHTGISDISSNLVLEYGWDKYQRSDFDAALPYFLELTTRPSDYLKGHHGLGWTYLNLRQLQNATNQFNLFFDTDSLDVILPTDSLYYDGKAGQAFLAYLSGNYSQCVSLTGQIGSDWVFTRDNELNNSDILVLKAICYYNQQLYSEALETVQSLDSDFNADLTFVEGIILLGNKIEQLKLTYQFGF